MAKYIGYELRLDGGRYTVFGPDGVRIGTFNDATSARRWVRIHRKAGRIARGAAATLAEPDQGTGPGGSAQPSRRQSGANIPSGSASAATDEPTHDVSDPIWDEERDKYRVECSCGWEMSEWAEESARALARDHLAAAAAATDEPGETPA